MAKRPSPPKRNARGEVHCRRCNRYLPSDHFGRLRDRTKFKSWCRPCTAAYDKRWRFLKPDMRPETERGYYLNERERRRERMRADIEFAREMLAGLRARGMRTMEIERLTGISRSNVYRLERCETTWVCKATIDKLSAALIATAGRKAA